MNVPSGTRASSSTSEYSLLDEINSNTNKSGSGSKAVSNNAILHQAFQEERKKDKEKIDKLQNKINKFENKLEKTLIEYENKSSKQISDAKAKVTESLAIFVSLFTFVSISFQLFDKLNDINFTISLISLLGGILIAFILTLHLMMRENTTTSEKKKNYRKFKSNAFVYFKEKLGFFLSTNIVLSFLMIVSLILLIRGIFPFFIEENNLVNNEKTIKQKLHLNKSGF